MKLFFLITALAIFIPLYGVQAQTPEVAQTAETLVTPDVASSSLPPEEEAEKPVISESAAAEPPSADEAESQIDVAAAPPAKQALTPMSPEKQIAEQIAGIKPDINVDLIPSLFFSRWEHDLIQDARRGLVTRPPEFPDEFAEDHVAPPPEEDTGPMPRNVTLAGIVYRSNKDWVIWLNNRRILPNAIPSEILDLQVYKDHIKLEWFDKDTNQVFPIKLRPHQTFNLDTRIFLPG